jgi:hypothetical protein
MTMNAITAWTSGTAAQSLCLSILVLVIPGLSAEAQEPGSTERIEYESSNGTSGYRRLVTREEAPDRTLETWVVEATSVNGGFDALLEVEEETLRIDEFTSQITRQEFTTDSDGRRVLLQTVRENRIESADGDVDVERDISEPDANGRLQLTRQERETTRPGPDGRFDTEIQVSRPGINSNALVPTERVLETGRSDAEGRVLEADRTSYSDPTGRGNWEALERRITTNEYADEEFSSVENVYRQNATGELTLNEQIVSREWTDDAGRGQVTQDTYSTDIPGQRTLRDPRLLRQVAVTRTDGASGGWEISREVRESRQGRFRVVERETETARATGGGGIDIERVVERLDANGRMTPVRTTSSTESAR